MRKSMKCLSILGLLVGVLGAVTVSASAAETEIKSGVYDLQATECEIKVYTGEGIQKDSENNRAEDPLTATPQTIYGKTEQLYAGAEAFEVTYTGAENGTFHLVLMLEGESKTPKAENIGYIDQTTAGTSGTVSFAVYPSQMKSGTYKIYKSVSGGAGLEEIASFKYYQAYTLGDVDSNDKITANDALFALQISVNYPTLNIGGKDIPVSDTMRKAADVDHSNLVGANDALLILQKSVGMNVF